MAGVRDSLIDLERHTRRLEENVNKLGTALQHWQTWDAEYEALKEEVASAAESGTTDFERLQADFEGELVKGKELKEIFGPNNSRDHDQIINILDRRIDYVTKNIETLKKQLQTAEKKLATALVISQPDAVDEEGQPMTEIIEELDDEDNVVSYKLNRPGESLPHIQEALQKVGIKDLADLDSKPTSETVAKPSKSNGESLSAVPQSEVAVPSKAAKKGVSFAEDAKPANDDAVNDPTVMSRNAVRVQNIMNTAKDQEKIIGENPMVPADEDPEDAELRQEMLRYSMGEVGAVVAELQIEEGATDTDDYEFEYSDEEMNDDYDSDDEEDKYGRYTGRVVTDDYKARMLELEQRLGVKSRFTAKEEERAAAAAQADDGSGSDDERIGRIVINRDAAPPGPTESALAGKAKNKPDKKKGVRFADSLDIASEDESVAPRATVRDNEPLVEPLSDIVERSVASKSTDSKPPRKASRFKSARDESASAARPARSPVDIPVSFHGQDRETAPTGPDGTTIADKLVERDVVSGPMPDDEYDDYMTHSEIAVEHQRLRRKFMDSQGGFLREEEIPSRPVEEVEGNKRQSRFKAARHSRQ
jgi:unconventional prefoldin RPB5 interactor 1